MSWISKTWKKVKNYVPAVAGAVASYYTGGLAPAVLGSAITMNTKQRQAQKDAEARQNQYNIEAENREFEYTRQLNAEMNAYNTPEAQMQRYVAAGINPYMASISSGTQGSAGSVSTHATQATPFETLPESMQRSYAIASAGMDLKQKQLALDSQKKQYDNLDNVIALQNLKLLNDSKIATYQALYNAHDWEIIKKHPDKLIAAQSRGYGVGINAGYNPFTGSINGGVHASW